MTKESKKFRLKHTVSLELDIREKNGGVLPDKYSEVLEKFWESILERMSAPKTHGEWYEFSQVTLTPYEENLYKKLVEMYKVEYGAAKK